MADNLLKPLQGAKSKLAKKFTETVFQSDFDYFGRQYEIILDAERPSKFFVTKNRNEASCVSAVVARIGWDMRGFLD
jgi:hypothetical protein